MRWMKVRGVQRRPMMNDREKLRVARVERKRPRGRREKDLMRWYWWGFVLVEVEVWRVRRAERKMGRRMSARM